jgi:hypothetical protein
MFFLALSTLLALAQAKGTTELCPLVNKFDLLSTFAFNAVPEMIASLGHEELKGAADIINILPKEGREELLAQFAEDSGTEAMDEAIESNPLILEYAKPILEKFNQERGDRLRRRSIAGLFYNAAKFTFENKLLVCSPIFNLLETLGSCRYEI